MYQTCISPRAQETDATRSSRDVAHCYTGEEQRTYMCRGTSSIRKPYGPSHGPTALSEEEALSYERGTPAGCDAVVDVIRQQSWGAHFAESLSFTTTPSHPLYPLTHGTLSPTTPSHPLHPLPLHPLIPPPYTPSWSLLRSRIRRSARSMPTSTRPGPPYTRPERCGPIFLSAGKGHQQSKHAPPPPPPPWTW